ncbi:MAG: WD40 repeat domain-containing protein [Ardenticatenaceae bacterium]|nr:WD40 repeat domain-containing protein [Ardenticatenaceae bacterium]
MTEILNPYVGPRTFTKDDRDRFFGREREARDLVSLVISERMVLFYSQSGAGKSSLINARVLPQLVEDEGFVALPVGRVNGELPPGIDDVDNIFVFNLILSLEQSGQDMQQFAHMPLTEFLRHLATNDGEHYFYQPQLADESEPAAEENVDYVEPPHILVIDQFEEIVTTHLARWEDREAFFRQLNRALLDDPLLWVVLTLREDFVAALRPYQRLLFNNMRARYYMQRMEASSAQEAVEQPAALGGRQFAPGVAKILVDNLRQIRIQGEGTQAGQFVEPVQLQVVCFQLWENLRDSDSTLITQQDLEELGDVDIALSQYYEETIAAALAQTSMSEVELRAWFDQELITEAETRGTVYQGEIETAGMSNKVVAVLVEHFLLRAEIRAGGTWYELVHDRFVTPILHANQAWRLRQSPLLRAAEAWDRADRSRDLLMLGEELKGVLATIQREEQEPLVQDFLAACEDAQSQYDLVAAQERAEKEARTATRLRRLTLALTGLVVVAIVAFVWASIASIYAQDQADEANSAATRAIAAQETSVYNEQLAQSLAATSDVNAGLAADAAATSVALAATSDTNAALAVEREEEAVTAQAIAVESEQLARENAAKALKSGRVALAQSLAAQAPRIVDLSNDTELSTLLALEALRIMNEEENDDRELVDTALREVLSEQDYNTVWLGHNGFVRDVVFDPNGRYMLSSEADGTVLLWNLDGPSSDFQNLGATMSASSLAISPDGGSVAVLRHDQQIDWWDISGVAARTSPEPVLLATFAPTGTPISRVLLGSGGSYLFAYSTSGAIWRWDLTAPEETAVSLYESADPDLVNLALSDDGRYLATYVRGTILVRDLNSASRAVIRQFGSSSGAGITHAIFAPDNSFLVTADDAGSIAMWNMVSSTFNVTRFASNIPTPIGDLSISHDGKTIAVIVSEDLAICLLDVENPSEEIFSLVGHNSTINAIAFNPADNVLASASDDRSIRLWQLGGTDIKPQVMREPGTDVVAVGFGQNGGSLVALAQNVEDFTVPHELYLWNTGNIPPRLQQKYIIPASENVAPPFDITGLTPAALYAEGRLLATTNYTNTINIWSFAGEALSPQNSLHADGTAVTALAFSKDGEQIAAATTGAAVYIWPPSGSEATILHGFDGRLHTLVFSDDGRTLAAANNTRSIYIWNLDGDLDTPLAFDSQHETWVSDLAFSPDGSMLATSGYDDLSINLWDLEDVTEPINTLIGHADWVLSLDFSPDGRTLASGSWDRTVRLWNLTAVDPNLSTTILKGHERQVMDVQFGATGGILATGSRDHTARLWLTGIEEFAAIACDQVRRNLSLGEWERYLRSTPEAYERTCDNWPVHSTIVERAAMLLADGDEAGAQSLLDRINEIEPEANLTVEALTEISSRNEARNLVLAGVDAAQEGDIETAVAKFAAAQAQDPGAMISDWDWNALCWFGSLWGYAADVLDSCEQAIALSPNNGDFYDSRGVARALTGDYDGAIADFQFFITYLQDLDVYEEGGEGREAWIEALQAGENPFTEEVLAELRN